MQILEKKNTNRASVKEVRTVSILTPHNIQQVFLLE